jgi:hypothetical protein
MPALRPCLRCGVLTRRAGGYCIECQPPYSRGKQRSGGTQQRFRRKLIREAGGVLACLACGAPDTPENPVEASHEYRLALGGSIAGPGALLCRRCNRGMDAAAERARRGRMG